MELIVDRYEDQQRFREAEPILLKVIESKKKALGAGNPSTLDVMAKLARLYHRQERLEEAEKLEVQVMRESQLALAPNNTMTLSLMNKLYHVIHGRNWGERLMHLPS